MKFDTVIIGGGLSGLISGIESARIGRKTAIISAGQSALHFWSGSFEFLCSDDGNMVVGDPLGHAAGLPPDHPYRKIGVGRTAQLLGRVAPILAEAGIKVSGTLDRNHFRLTPLGIVKPAWLTLDDYFAFDRVEDLAGKKVSIVNIYGYIDFYPRFLAYGLSKHGTESRIADVNMPQLDVLRKSTTEMRATNISRFLTDDAVDMLADAINRVSEGSDFVIMPAVLGIFSDGPVQRLRQRVDRPVYFIATTPASVPGVRCQLALRDLFTSMGGYFMPGDTVTRGDIAGGHLERVYTANFGSVPVEADNYVISTGSFFGQGLIADMHKIYEPILGLDIVAGESRTDWYDKNFYNAQPYMSYGVITDDRFRPSVKGKTIENLYATGALLSGFNALKEGSGAGITLATALHAAGEITGVLSNA